ncbi:MAG: hypothetical protein ACJ0QH_03930 [Flavobacteriales bacterium]
MVLHDLMGKEEHRQAVLPQQNNSLNLEHLQRGIYLLRLLISRTTTAT